jgi:hypothetical protein
VAVAGKARSETKLPAQPLPPARRLMQLLLLQLLLMPRHY